MQTVHGENYNCQMPAGDWDSVEADCYYERELCCGMGLSGGRCLFGVVGLLGLMDCPRRHALPEDLQVVLLLFKSFWTC
jgi:hypothetical protein